jgi:hypothetical protein
MSRRPNDSDEPPQLDASSLPQRVQQLWETMLRLDPSWDIHEWLDSRAEEELKLVGANLAREKMRLEQRIGRLETLAAQIGRRDELVENDPYQSNLFDAFGPSDNEAETEEVDDNDWEPHPAVSHIRNLPEDGGDDPLLAVCAQSILMEIEQAVAANTLPVSLGTLGEALIPRGIDSEELVEALEWLLGIGEVIEVAEDEFVTRDVN